MTAVYITAIIAAMIVVNVIVCALRDVAQAKHQGTAARNDDSKETT